jgi:hypothetical protein
MNDSDFNPGKTAGNAFASGFAGCLGVGLAILAVIVVIILILAISSHH